MKRTVAYYRSSTDLQENSIPMQRTFAQQYAVDHVLTIEEEFEDAGVSARKNTVVNRPNMYRLIQEIQERKIGTILVYKRDRLARNSVEYMEFYRLCREKQVQILFTAKNEFPVLYTPLGEFIELIMAGMVEHEAEQIADRIRATHIANFMNKVKAGRLPYGLKEVKSGKKTVIEYKTEQAKSELKTIFKDFVLLNIGLKEFAAHLDGLGFMRMPRKKKRRREEDVPEWEESEDDDDDAGVLRKWNEQDIIKVISNPIYKGLHRRKFGEQFYEVDRPECRIVSDELWEEANRLLKNFLPVPKEHPYFDFWLDGFLACPENGCDKFLLPNYRRHQGESIPTYECAAKHHPFSKKKVMVAAKSVHEVVIDQIRVEVNNFAQNHMNELFNQVANEKKRELRKKIREKEDEVSRLESEFTKFVSDSMHGDFTDTLFVSRLNGKYEELQKAREFLRELKVQAEDRSLFSHVNKKRTRQLQRVLEILGNMQPHEIRKLLMDLVYKIEVNHKGRLHLILKYPLKSIKESTV